MVTAPLTVVTALIDLGRSDLQCDWYRSWMEKYIKPLEILCRMAVPMVLFIDKKVEPFVDTIRHQDKTVIHIITLDDLLPRPYSNLIHAIRTGPTWKKSIGWIKQVPQDSLPHYLPCVFMKPFWMQRAARDNTFHSDSLLWLDSGLPTTVPEHYFYSPQFTPRMIERLKKFLFVGFPYVGGPEIHGFERSAIARYCGVPYVDKVMRGGVFGGNIQYVEPFVQLYQHYLADTLCNQNLGTEESIFTILHYKYPQLFDAFMVEMNGLVYPFFEDVVNYPSHKGRGFQSNLTACQCDKTYIRTQLAIPCIPQVHHS